MFYLYILCFYEDYRIFKTFRTKAEANELKTFFEEQQIPVEIIDNSNDLVGSIYTGESYQEPFQFLIPQKLFEKGNKLLEQEAEESIANLPADYYLYRFTKEELYEILEKPDEWGSLDYTLAKQILVTKGEIINDQIVNTLKEKRNKKLKEPETNNNRWIVIAYISILFGGFIGIIVGHYFWQSKKTIPNGEKVYRYNTNDRKHGKFIFFLGIIALVLWTVFKISGTMDQLLA